MKRFITCFLSVALVLLGSLCVSAQVVTKDKAIPEIGATGCGVWMDDYTADVGDTVDAVVWYKADKGFAAFNFGFTYDTDKLEIVTHYSDLDEDDVLVESANSGWYDMNGKPTKPAQWIFPQISQDNQDNLKKSSAEVAALSVPYHYAWGLSDATRNWGSTEGEEKVMLIKVSFKIKDGARGNAYVKPEFYAASPKYNADGVKAYTVVSDPSYASKISINSNNFLVSYSLGDHAAGDAVAPQAVTLEKASPTVTLPAAPKAASGYTFTGWLVGKNVMQPAATFDATEDIEIVAQWRELEKYTVTYANGGHGTLSRQSETVTEGGSVTLPAALAATGYEFLGWSDGNNVYDPLDIVPVSGSITFTAAWKAEVYTVTYALGTHADKSAVAPKAVDYEYGTPAITLPAAPAAEEGFEFIGWSDGTSLYGAETTFTPTEAVTLTAAWKEEGTALVEPKAVFNKYNKIYTVSLWFSGVKADSVAFGFDYDKTQLEFTGFTPAEGFDTFKVGGVSMFEVNTAGHYENQIMLDQDGIVAGKCIDAEAEPVLIGKLTFKYISGNEFKTEDSATRFYGAVVAKKDYVSNGTSYVYIPSGTGLEVIEKPVAIDPVAEEISEVPVFTLTGVLGVAREKGVAKSPAYACIYNADGSVYDNKVVLETETDNAVSGVVNYKLELAAGDYKIEVFKNGYLRSGLIDVKSVEGGTIAKIDLIPGDIKNKVLDDGGDGKIDLADFVRVVRGFDVDNALTTDEILCVDINEDGVVTVADLAFVKANYGAAYEVK